MQSDANKPFIGNATNATHCRWPDDRNVRTSQKPLRKCKQLKWKNIYVVTGVFTIITCEYAYRNYLSVVDCLLFYVV